MVLLGAIVGSVSDAGPQTRAGVTSALMDTVAVYSGVYSSTARESIFIPCEVPGIGSGWWLRFEDQQDAAFLRHHDAHPGVRALPHFIRVRGRLSAPGSYGPGFQNREFVVDSVLEIKDSPQPCLSYQDQPLPWLDVKSSGEAIIGAAMTDDRSRLAVINREGIISIWNVTERKVLNSFPSADKGDLSAAGVPLVFNRDGKRLAVGGVDGVVRVWDPATGQRLRTFAAIDTITMVDGRKRIVPSGPLTFNESGTLLARRVAGRPVILSTTSGKQLGAIPGPWRDKFLFVGDSSFIVAGDSGFIDMHPRFGDPPIARLRLPTLGVTVMERSPDGRWLLAKSSGDTAYLWSISDGRPGPTIVLPEWGGGRLVAFSPDGNTLAMSSGTTGLYLWETKTGRPLRTFLNLPWNLQRAWFTADGQSIIIHPTFESEFRILHLDSEKHRRGPDGNDLPPVQATWPAWINPEHRPGRVLGSVSGFVRLSPSSGVRDADVSIFDGDRPGDAPIGRTTTNAAGHYLIQMIRVPHLIVRVAKSGFSSDVKYVHAQERANVDFQLRVQR